MWDWVIDGIVQDVKYALRSFRRTPQFTAAAVMTVALGIGANTAMFSLADATALRPPDVPRAGEIVRVFTSSKDTPFGEVSYPDSLDLRTLEDLYRSRALLPSRMMSQIVTALSVLGPVLACVGLYGVVTFLFSSRTHEIGIRMAVGATPTRVLRTVLTHAMVLAGPGLILGLGAAALLTPLLASPAFDFVEPNDPAVLTAAPLTMALVCLLAAALPARRAAHRPDVGPATGLTSIFGIGDL